MAQRARRASFGISASAHQVRVTENSPVVRILSRTLRMTALAFPVSTSKLSAQARRQPRLSVVLLSTGPETTFRSTLGILEHALSDVGADVVVVRRQSEGASEPLCPIMRSEMVDEGMQSAIGDVVVVRHESQVGDCAWLKPYLRILSTSNVR